MSPNESNDTAQFSNTTQKVNSSDEPRTSKRLRESSPEDENKSKNAKFRSDTERTQLCKFCTAIRENDVDTMAILLKSGVDVNDETLGSATAIFSAIDTSIGVDILKYLMENGADIYIKEKVFGYTLLHMAAHCNDQRKFEILVGKNFDVNAKAKNDVTPLHLSAMVGNVDVVKMLIERHADVNCLTHDSQLTPLHLASMKYDVSNVYNGDVKKSFNQSSLVHTLWSEPLRNRKLVPVIELLVKSGADVNARDAYQNTALHLATLQSDKNVTETLLKLGAYVDVANVKGSLPLHNVLESLNVEGLTCLLEFGADINDISCRFQDIREYESSQVNAFCNNVLEHTNKLRAADLPVAEVYKSDFHKSFWLSYRTECRQEVERLKAHFIVDNVSLYEFLHMRIGRRVAYVRHVPLDLEMKFPKYYGIVYGSCRQAVVRRSLIELSKMVWTHLTEINLPDVCFERIFLFLDNIDLTFFVAGAHGFLKAQNST